MQSVKTDGFSPHKSAKLEVTATGGEGTVLDDSNVKEPEAIIPRTSPEGSPSSSSSRLFAPHYAGNIQHVMEIGEVDDEQWEEDVAGYPEPEWIAPGGGDGGDDQVDEGRPPQVDPDELAQLDEAAGFEEIKRFLEMKVVEEPSAEDLEQGVVLSTKSVMDWRFRNQKWQRRCRYVAREFRAGDKGSAATFAPTSGVGARLVLVAHCCSQWLLAFLLQQREKILVEKPSWWSDESSTRYILVPQQNACLDREMLRNVSLSSSVSIYKLLG